MSQSPPVPLSHRPYCPTYLSVLFSHTSFTKCSTAPSPLSHFPRPTLSYSPHPIVPFFHAHPAPLSQRSLYLTSNKPSRPLSQSPAPPISLSYTSTCPLFHMFLSHFPTSFLSHSLSASLPYFHYYPTILRYPLFNVPQPLQSHYPTPTSPLSH
jgi:hypothetical protein